METRYPHRATVILNRNRDSGYVLVVLLVLLSVMAIVAVGINRRAGIEAAIVANQASAIQQQAGAEGVFNESIWRLKNDWDWRVDEDLFINGTTYHRHVYDEVLPGYPFVVTIAVWAPGSEEPLKASFSMLGSPQLEFYFSDKDNHVIRHVDKFGTISTVAGNGWGGDSGDGGPATSAELKKPMGVAMDDGGNLYICDQDNSRVRVVDSFGIIHAFAGTGQQGYSGDGGPAVSAKLNRPQGIAIDNDGNVLIADKENNVVRIVDQTGIINTFVGTGSKGYSGDGGPAVNAEMEKPEGLAVDADDNVYIADAHNEVIRMVDDNGIITTVAGNGTKGYSGDNGPATAAQLDHPVDVTLWNPGSGGGPLAFGGDHEEGAFYICDNHNHCIRKVDTNGIITTVAGTTVEGYGGDGGPASLAKLNKPQGVFIDALKNVYICDQKNERVRRIDADDWTIHTTAGNGSWGYSGDGGPATDAKLDDPTRVFAIGTIPITGPQRIWESY